MVFKAPAERLVALCQNAIERIQFEDFHLRERQVLGLPLGLLEQIHTEYRQLGVTLPCPPLAFLVYGEFREAPLRRYGRINKPLWHAEDAWVESGTLPRAIGATFYFCSPWEDKERLVELTYARSESVLTEEELFILDEHEGQPFRIPATDVSGSHQAYKTDDWRGPSEEFLREKISLIKTFLDDWVAYLRVAGGVEASEAAESVGVNNGLSTDGRTLHWGGGAYPIGPTAVDVIRLLVEAYEKGERFLSQAYLMSEADCETEIRNLVRNNNLEDVVIRQTTPGGKIIKGMWGLVDSAEIKEKSTAR